jgi:hypothetical protein
MESPKCSKRVTPGNFGADVRHADEGHVFFHPVAFKGIGTVRAEHQNFGLTFNKFCVVLAQLRQMFAAERSGKGAHQHQND